MNEKLFDIPAEKRNLVFYLETYKRNKIVLKLMRLLKVDDKFIVDDVKGTGDSRIFEICIFSNESDKDIQQELRKRIIILLGTHFPDNYLFDFKERKLGFVNSFNVYSDRGFHFEMCHKIKEVRKQGTIIPENNITQ